MAVIIDSGLSYPHSEHVNLTVGRHTCSATDRSTAVQPSLARPQGLVRRSTTRQAGAELLGPTIATRARHLIDESRALKRQLDDLTRRVAPTTTAVFAIGPETAAALLVTIGDNPDRLRNEASFAHLCGVAPIPASSGKTTRHRLHRGGDRSGNRAQHLAVIVRLRYSERTRAYVTRRTSEGKTMPQISRCLKRYLAREIFNAIRTDYAALMT